MWRNVIYIMPLRFIPTSHHFTLAGDKDCYSILFNISGEFSTRGYLGCHLFWNQSLDKNRFPWFKIGNSLLHLWSTIWSREGSWSTLQHKREFSVKQDEIQKIYGMEHVRCLLLCNVSHVEARHPLEARRPSNSFFSPHPDEFWPRAPPHNATNKTAIEHPQPKPRTTIWEGLGGPWGRYLRISREGSISKRFGQVEPRALEDHDRKRTRASRSLLQLQRKQ